MVAGTNFSRTELGKVARAASRAEELTGSFYAIPGREWVRFPYELRTLADGAGPARRAFADVVRVVPSRPGTGVPRFRIRLRDDTILSAVRNSGNAVRLWSLLLYVLTHEIVHVVRFGAGFARFDGEGRDPEEVRVHAITRKILRPESDETLRRVMNFYRDTRLEGDAAGVSP